MTNFILFTEPARHAVPLATLSDFGPLQLAADPNGRRGLLLDDRWLQDNFLRHSLSENEAASMLLSAVHHWRSSGIDKPSNLVTGLERVQQAASKDAVDTILDFLRGEPQELSELSRNSLFATELQQALEAEYGQNDYGPTCRVRPYSGRGMYGKCCLSISLSDDLDTDSLISDTLNDWGTRHGTEETLRLQKMLSRRSSDSLGRGLVRYFPNFPLDSLYSAGG